MISILVYSTNSPEFLNRIDDTVIFNTLDKGDILKIVDLALAKLDKRLHDMGHTIKLNKSAKEFIADKGYDPSYGARPLHRAIQKYLEDPLAELILNLGNRQGLQFKVTATKGQDELTIQEVKVEKESQALNE